MSEAIEPGRPNVAEIQARLHDAARLLRESRTLDDESRKIVAELVDELGSVLQSASVPPAEVAHLAESTAHLVESLHHHHETGLLGRVREHFENALANAESQAPLTVGLARRVLNALADIGI